MFYEKAYALMEEKGADALLVSDGANMRYLSGFRGETGYLYLSRARKALVTDSRYTAQAKDEAAGFDVLEIHAGEKYGQLLANLMEQDHAGRVAFEGAHVRYRDFQELQKWCKGRLTIALEDELDACRCVKADWEIERLEKAEAIGDAAFAHILKVLRPGITELFVAAELEYFLKTHGAEAISFETIVASGPNAALPHAIPSNRTLQDGDFVTLDFGCVYEGYCSDMTRTVVIGKASEKQKEIYEIVRKAQLEGLAACRAGKVCRDVDRAARAVIEQAGYGKSFGHGLGHGVGLRIHEEPRLSSTCGKTLSPNMVVTVEPGIYLPGFGGVRIEDMVAVTRDGCRNLAHSPKELIEV